jgi:DNA-binding NarL/FixJ family response regulator
MSNGSTDSHVTRVLVVDDAPSIRALLRSTLPLHGFEIVAEAGRVAEGIEMARQEQPDLIVLDVQMPQVNGVDAIEPLKAEVPNAVILMYSSHDEHDMRDEALRKGADAFFDKLAPISQMADEMHRLLESARA